MSESSWGKRRYRTTNWKAYNAALKARGDLTIWLDKDMQWQAVPDGKPGRNKTFSDAAIQFCLTVKCLFSLPLRQTLGLIQSLLRMAGLPWSAPDYSTVCRRQKKGLNVQVRYRPSRNGLHLLADSTGIKFLGEGEWKTKKHGTERRRQWRKLRKGLVFAHRNEAVNACRRLGRYIWKRWSGYHRRSLVETKMNCFKRLGEKVMARTFERQVAELNIRASILNRFTELGTPQTVAVA
ncbi:IS5 family transposase [Diaphorobacter caeni]|uniref:IS5 family transposase n=1 Tax=Diaphorobacter caeni TaxID=2784387 RepID=UPI00188F265B|nr:IS5 family transposase [Diaphorobacter caeni]MBF5006633.1 IS5 family transposase [Diaphorobacter caeni]